MLPRCSPHDWLDESEPLLFDDEFCENLIKDLQSIPTPPQSPPLKYGPDKPLSDIDHLELFSQLLVEDSDFSDLNWNSGFDVSGREGSDDSLSDDCLWPCSSGKSAEEKMPILSTSPLLANIDAEIFAEIAGSTLDCQGVSLGCHPLIQSDELMLDSPEQSEVTSDYGSLSAAGESSTSDSEEEIDVVTVRRFNAHTHSHQQGDDDVPCDPQWALKQCHLEIQQQHNYAAPRPSSPPPSIVCVKRTRSGPKTSRYTCEFENDEVRRRTHNVMERQRRSELKNCFLRLRNNVPELSNNDKASKVIILKRAKESIRNLESQAQTLTQKRDRLRERQKQILTRLKQLKGL